MSSAFFYIRSLIMEMFSYDLDNPETVEKLESRARRMYHYYVLTGGNLPDDSDDPHTSFSYICELPEEKSYPDRDLVSHLLAVHWSIYEFRRSVPEEEHLVVDRIKSYLRTSRVELQEGTFL